MSSVMLQILTNEADRGVLPPIIADRRLESDLDLAAAVQRQMLPRNTKQLAGIRYAATSFAASRLAGDYYDFLDLGPYTLGIVLADVSGKGIAAALLAASLQASIRSESLLNPHDLAAMLARVNAHFYRSTLAEQYATLFFARYDEQTRRLDYVNAGQQPVVILRADLSVERLESTALPLGMVDRWSGEMKSVILEPGDRLFLASDGVIEAGLENGCEFGEEGFISVAASSAERNIECAVSRLAQAAHSYVLNGQTDDMTIVAVDVL